MILLKSTLLVHIEKEKSLVNQRLTRDLWYPDPGSNRDGLLHWCLRPARLPIPPSGHCIFNNTGAKVKFFPEFANFILFFFPNS